VTILESWCDHPVTVNFARSCKRTCLVNQPRRDALGRTCLEMPPARSTMTEMRADKLSGVAPRAGSFIATLGKSRRRGLNEYAGG